MPVTSPGIHQVALPPRDSVVGRPIATAQWGLRRKRARLQTPLSLCPTASAPALRDWLLPRPHHRHGRVHLRGAGHQHRRDVRPHPSDLPPGRHEPSQLLHHPLRCGVPGGTGRKRGRGWGFFREQVLFFSVKKPGLGLCLQPPSVTPQPPSVALRPPSVALQPPSVAFQPPSVTLQPPSVAFQPPSVALQPPSVAFQPPSVTLQPPSVTLQPPSEGKDFDTKKAVNI